MLIISIDFILQSVQDEVTYNVNDLNYEGEVLNIIDFCENVLLENLNSNDNTQIIMGGDFNFDKEKLQNSKVLQCLSNFILCTDLKIANNNIQHTFHNDTRSCMLF